MIAVRSHCWVFASDVKRTENVKSCKNSKKNYDEMSIKGEK